MAGKKLTDVHSKMVDLLQALGADDRLRVINSALILLGDSPIAGSPPVGVQNTNSASSELAAPAGGAALQTRAKNWISQNGLIESQLSQVFHIEGQTGEVIASDVPGSNQKEKTYSAYILLGVLNLLTAGDARADDEQARSLCKRLGCFNVKNHTKYMSEKPNTIGGSKAGGWIITGPGLTRAAEMIKQMAQN